MSEGQLGASVTDDRRVERERRRVFEAVGKFLFEHSLDPIPANYMLVHMLVTGSNASAIAAIEEATGDGLRLTQDDADLIMTMLGEASPTPVDRKSTRLNVTNAHSVCRLLLEKKHKA